MNELIYILNPVLLLTALILLIETRFNLQRKFTAPVILALLAFSLFTETGSVIPVGLNSVFAQLSISTYCLLSYYIFSKIILKSKNLTALGNKICNENDNHSHSQQTSNNISSSYSLIAVTGIAFYILSLGFGNFDPYQWGYNALIPSVVACLLAIYMAWKKSYRNCLILCMVIASYAAGLLESNNFWDYLFDPLLILFALSISIKHQIIKRKALTVNSGA